MTPTLEHHLLRADIVPPEMHKAITEAMQIPLAAVVVGPVWVSRVATQLRGSGVAVVAAVGFPLGINKSTLKAIEATSAIKDGANEIEVVPWLVNLMRQDFDAMRAELMEIVRAARAVRPDVGVRVIIEAGRLLNSGSDHGDRGDRGEAAIADVCRAVRQSGCDAIVTGVAADATAEMVRVVKRHAEGLAVKAVGDAKDVQAFLDAGADRVGTEGDFAFSLSPSGRGRGVRD
jgi:deoxyribose-phosphate aldolase